MMKNKNIKIVLLTFILLFSYCAYLLMKPITKNNISIDRLVYLKRNNTPFTGILEVNEPPDKAKYQYCNGIPCGKWEYYYNNERISHGVYLDKTLLSKNILNLIGLDTFAIDHWTEGESLDKDPSSLTFIILKSNSFFDADKKQYENYFNDLAHTIVKDVKIPYSDLYLYFSKGLHYDSEKYEVEYWIMNGKPVRKTKENIDSLVKVRKTALRK